MRLLKLTSEWSFDLVTFTNDDIPPYAILSHTWSRFPEHEVTFTDVHKGTGQEKPGFTKLRFCAEQARAHDLEYFWIDTCCIDKSSSSELSEAVNSMFRYYQRAERCYVYLADVSASSQNAQLVSKEWRSEFRHSRWFTRGWTLQELLAPRCVEFYSCDHVLLGDKTSLESLVHEITGVPMGALRGHDLSSYNVEERVSWSKTRKTSKEEDKVYSLLGICKVHMPLIYGEGRANAMRRLLKEVADSTANEACPDPFGSIEHDSTMYNTRVSAGLEKTSVSENRVSLQDLPHQRQQPFSTVPFPRDPNYVDRGDLLACLQSALQEPASRAAIVGLGGIGKSQLAIEYAYRVRERSPQTWVFWISGSTVARFKETCHATADRLGLVTPDRQQSNALSLFQQWLRDEKNGPWVIVVDNADDISVFSRSDELPGERPIGAWPETKIHFEFLPQTSNGRIVFTSRREELAARLTGSHQSLINVGPMDISEATTLFDKKCARKQVQQELEELLEIVGLIPLAITQAASFINRAGPRGSVKRYLQLYHQNEQSRTSLLRFDAGDHRRDHDACNSVLLTWQLSFSQISQERPSAAKLLSIMSFFHWQNIPEFALRDATMAGDREPELDPEFEFQEDLTYLHGYSLIDSLPEGDMFGMHRLVQLSMQLWLKSEGNFQTLQLQFLRTLDGVFPPANFENWETCRALFPHIRFASIEGPACVKTLEYQDQILRKGTKYAYASGQLQAAERTARKRLELAEASQKNPKSLFPMGLHLLGKILREQGRLTEAEEALRRAMDMSVGTLGPEHPNTLSSVIELSLLLHEQQDLEEAEKLSSQASQIFETAREHDDLHASSAAIKLAILLLRQSHLKAAERLGRQTLRIRQRLLVQGDPSTLESFIILSLILVRQGKFEEAEEMNRRAREGREKIYGSEHFLTLQSIYFLAYLKLEQRDYPAALSSHTRALAGFTKCLGPHHSLVKSCAKWHDTVLHLMEKLNSQGATQTSSG